MNLVVVVVGFYLLWRWVYAQASRVIADSASLEKDYDLRLSELDRKLSAVSEASVAAMEVASNAESAANAVADRRSNEERLRQAPEVKQQAFGADL